jgi:hypothetical protein
MIEDAANDDAVTAEGRNAPDRGFSSCFATASGSLAARALLAGVEHDHARRIARHRGRQRRSRRKGDYRITMVRQAPDDNHLKLTIK